MPGADVGAKFRLDLKVGGTAAARLPVPEPSEQPLDLSNEAHRKTILWALRYEGGSYGDRPENSRSYIMRTSSKDRIAEKIAVGEPVADGLDKFDILKALGDVLTQVGLSTSFKRNALNIADAIKLVADSL